MKKKILIFTFALLQFSNTTATGYPEKLNDGKKFDQISQFQDIYQSIYDDVLTIDETEVIRRTCQHQSIDCTYVSDEIKTSFTDFIEYFRATSKSRRQYDNNKNLITNTLGFEQDLYNQEKTWARSNQMMTMWSDTDFGGKNAPFDLMADSLESIETTFVGPRAKKFEAQFSVKGVSEKLLTDAEDWQNQRDNAQVSTTNYNESEMASIGGLSDNLQQYQNKHPAANSLVSQKVAMNLWDKWYATTALGSSMCPELDMNVDKPLKNNDEPLVLEDESIPKNLQSGFQAYLEAMSQQDDCYLKADTSADTNQKPTKANTRQTDQLLLQQCNNERLTEQLIQKIAFKKNQTQNLLKLEYKTVKAGLNYFESFIASIHDMTKKQIDLFKCYLLHIRM